MDHVATDATACSSNWPYNSVFCSHKNKRTRKVYFQKAFQSMHFYMHFTFMILYIMKTHSHQMMHGTLLKHVFFLFLWNISRKKIRKKSLIWQIITSILMKQLPLSFHYDFAKTKQTLHEKCPKMEFFLVRIFLYSVRIQENTYQEKLRIWTLITQWNILNLGLNPTGGMGG